MSIFQFDKLALSGAIDDETEFIPLMTTEDEEEMDQEDTPETLSVLPLRNTVLFPGVVIPITVGRDKSISLIQDANKGDKTIGVISQRDDTVEDPNQDQLHKVGTIARILKIFKMPDGNTTAIIQGKKRFKLLELTAHEPYLKAKIEAYEVGKVPKDAKFKALVSSIKDMALKIIDSSPNIPSEASFAIKNIESNSFLINFIASNMNADVDQKQNILEEKNCRKRAQFLLQYVNKELKMLELKNDIQSKVRTDIDQQQKEYFLNQQMKMIQEELGGNPQDQEIEEFTKKAKKKKWNKETKERFEKELGKLERMHSASAEYSVQVNYVETLLDLPWNEVSKDKFDLKKAKEILDRDHFGLKEVKERIIEHLAVLKLKGNMKSPILG